MPQNLIFW